MRGKLVLFNSSIVWHSLNWIFVISLKLKKKIKMSIYSDNGNVFFFCRPYYTWLQLPYLVLLLIILGNSKKQKKKHTHTHNEILFDWIHMKFNVELLGNCILILIWKVNSSKCEQKIQFDIIIPVLLWLHIC